MVGVGTSLALFVRPRAIIPFILFALPALSSAQVRISQVYIGGGEYYLGYNRDFIELYNAGAEAVSLEGWSVQYAPGRSSEWQKTDLHGTIAAGRYFLVAGAAGPEGKPLPAPDVDGDISMARASGKVALCSTQTPFVDACPASGVIDLLGYGDAGCFEGTGGHASISPGLSYQRAGCPRGATDRNRNTLDFETREPYPANSSTPMEPAIESVTLTPSTIRPGQKVTLTVVTRRTWAPFDDIYASLKSLGGTFATLKQISDTVWTTSIGADLYLPSGVYPVDVTAVLGSACAVGRASASLTMDARPYTVCEALNSTETGYMLVRGVVTSTHNEYAFVQDPGDAGSGCGMPLQIIARTGIADVLKPGNVVVLTGKFPTYYTLRAFNVGGARLDTAAQGMPEPQEIADIGLGDGTAFSGKRIRLTGVRMPDGPPAMPATVSARTIDATDAHGNPFSVWLHLNLTEEAATPFPGVPGNPLLVETRTDGSKVFPELQAGNVYDITGCVLPIGGKAVLFPDSADDFRLLDRRPLLYVSGPPVLVAGAVGQIAARVAKGWPASVAVDAGSLGIGRVIWLNSADGELFLGEIRIGDDVPAGDYLLPVLAFGWGAVDEMLLPVQVRQRNRISEVRALPDGTAVTICGSITSVHAGVVGTAQVQDESGGIRIVGGIGAGVLTRDRGVAVTGVKVTVNGLPAVSYDSGQVYLYEPSEVSPTTLAVADWDLANGRLVRSPFVDMTALSPGTGTGYYATDKTAFGHVIPGAWGYWSNLLAAGHTYNLVGIVEPAEAAGRKGYALLPRDDNDVVMVSRLTSAPQALSFTVQPGGSSLGEPLQPAPEVAVVDGDGRIVSEFRGPVEIALGSQTARLLCGATAKATGGKAVFPMVVVDRPGEYTLTASTVGLAAVGSTSFAVTEGAAPTMEDVIACLRSASGGRGATARDVARFDVTHDGGIGVRDAAVLLRRIHGL
jgi:hypothetical protein